MSDEKHTIWIKCDANFFGLQNDLYIAAAYYPPKFSSSNSHETNPQENDTIFKKLEKDIHKYSTHGNICTIGDFNSRIANQNESFLINNPFPTNEESDCDENIKEYINKRNSEDQKKNSYGTLLLKLNNENKLLTLNGRKIGDTTGRFTCHKYNGSSVVDLCICDSHLYNSVSSFKVLPHPWFSDHCPIITTISTKKLNKLTNEWDTSKLTDAPDKYYWDEEGLTKYKNKLNNNETKTKLEHLLTETNPDIVATNLESILTDIANKTLKKRVIKNKVPTNTPNIWMTKDAMAEQKTLKKARNAFLKTPHDLNRRSFYLNLKKKFKKSMYLLKRGFQEKKMNIIGKIAKKSPNDFWKAIKKLMNDTKEKQNNAIAPKIWNEYFHKLLNTNKNSNYDKWHLTQTELDRPLTLEEITTELKKCKNNKSSSSSITFEMLKSAPQTLAPYLRHLFNLVLVNEAYPQLWNISLLVPIYKAGVHSNPSNYRGIAVGNHISKLFAKCLNKRIDAFIELQNKLPDNSLGFRKGLRTEDGMFLLKTVTNKYTKLGKRLFTIFVDFSKFYDTINHEILLNKLFNFGVTGNLFNAIRNMYKGVSYTIKIAKDGPTIT